MTSDRMTPWVRARAVPALGLAAVLLIPAGGGAQQPPPAEAAPDSIPPPADAPPATDPTSPTPAPPEASQGGPDADEEAAIAAELARIQAARQAGAGGDEGEGAANVAPPIGGEAGAAGIASARGLSNLMNPALSVNALSLVGGTSRRAAAANGESGELVSGITLQEVEIVASAIVDPFFRADVTLAGDGEEIGFEEAILTTLEIRYLTLRVGQMHAALGRHNRLHTHAFPFLTAPQPWRVLLGPEGLVDPGLSAELLLPLPFYTEVTAQVFRGEWAPFAGGVADDPTTPADEAVPDRRRDEDLGALGHLKTLFDLSDSSTVELGGSWLGGRNGHGGFSHVVGADLTVKWRPVEAERYRGVDWTSELLWVSRGDAPTPEDREALGAYSAVRAQFAQRFWAQVRGSVLEHPRGGAARTLRGEALFAFVPSEFSALRLQYALERTGSDRPVHEGFAQAIFSIGPHPSHSY